MNAKISIIVPVFNIKDYLLRCVDSLVKQTYPNTEIVLIDDGSTDGSEILCDRLMNSYPQVRAYHKTNGGLSDARNYGIAHSTGEYITFVDGDDYLHPEACERLFQTATDLNAKLAVGGLMIVDEKGTVRKEEPLCSVACTRCYEEALKLVFLGKGYSACGKLYVRELFDEIQFPIGKIDEDFATMYKLFIEAKEIAYCPDYVYYYYKRAGSITKSNFNTSKLDFVNNAADAAAFIQKHISDIELHARADAFLCRRIDTVIRMIIIDNHSKQYRLELQKLVRMLRAYKKVVFVSPHIENKDKVIMLIEMINPKWLIIRYHFRRMAGR